MDIFSDRASRRVEGGTLRKQLVAVFRERARWRAGRINFAEKDHQTRFFVFFFSDGNRKEIGITISMCLYAFMT